jgi:hypothetical protein
MDLSRALLIAAVHGLCLGCGQSGERFVVAPSSDGSNRPAAAKSAEVVVEAPTHPKQRLPDPYPVASAYPYPTAPPAYGGHACKGQNDCKGLGGCKTNVNACKGQNVCKGQGGCKTL